MANIHLDLLGLCFRLLGEFDLQHTLVIILRSPAVDAGHFELQSNVVLVFVDVHGRCKAGGG